MSFSIYLFSFFSTFPNKKIVFFQVIWALQDCKVSLFLYLNIET
jgi:hypothetical protein